MHPTGIWTELFNGDASRRGSCIISFFFLHLLPSLNLKFHFSSWTVHLNGCKIHTQLTWESFYGRGGGGGDIWIALFDEEVTLKKKIYCRPFNRNLTTTCALCTFTDTRTRAINMILMRIIFEPFFFREASFFNQLTPPLPLDDSRIVDRLCAICDGPTSFFSVYNRAVVYSRNFPHVVSFFAQLDSRDDLQHSWGRACVSLPSSVSLVMFLRLVSFGAGQFVLCISMPTYSRCFGMSAICISFSLSLCLSLTRPQNECGEWIMWLCPKANQHDIDCTYEYGSSNSGTYIFTLPEPLEGK